MTGVNRTATAAAALATGLVWTTGAGAVEATFNNHLRSAPMVSPAQIYQMEKLTTDFALGYKNEAWTDKAGEDADEVKDSLTGTNVFAAGIYNVEQVGLRTGLSVDYFTGTYTDETLAAGEINETELESTNFVVTPQVAYPVGPVVLGAALDVNQEAIKYDESFAVPGGDEIDQLENTYTTFRPGVVYAQDKIEAGIAYASPNNRDTNLEDEELAVKDPAEVTLHGRYALNETLAVGGIIENKNWEAINEDLYTDRQSYAGTVEYGAGPVKVEGNLGYSTAYYAEDEQLSQDTVGTIDLGAATDYSINETSRVGGAVDYAFGSDEVDEREVTRDTLTVAVRGDLQF